MGAVIKVENLGKLYRLGGIGTGTISHDLNRWWAKMRGKEDPFLKLGQSNDRSKKGSSDFVWALKDINFEVQQGDLLGVIGKNGAGKSTLLKILSRTTTPTVGTYKAKGRIASLLEVGTGFHPELSGRENIFLNGAILGMSKAEIKSKFDEIVDFSGVERFVDTPVKRYSSGMYVRLAFAVAAHLESEILIVDEVLAVGDAEFQKKCMGKMSEVSKGQGRTVLFVSHNMLAIKSLCNKGLLMQNGMIADSGDIHRVVNSYSSQNVLSSYRSIEQSNKGFSLHSIQVSHNGTEGNFNIEEELVFDLKVSSNQPFKEVNVNLFFNTLEGSLIFATCSKPEKFDEGAFNYQCTIPAGTLNDNVYSIDVMVVENGEKALLHIKEAISIEGMESKRSGSWLAKFPGLIRPTNYKWEKNVQ